VRAAWAAYWAVPGLDAELRLRLALPDGGELAEDRIEVHQADLSYRRAALEAVEDWLAEPSEERRLHAARLASLPGAPCAERQLAALVARAGGWREIGRILPVGQQWVASPALEGVTRRRQWEAGQGLAAVRARIAADLAEPWEGPDSPVARRIRARASMRFPPPADRWAQDGLPGATEEERLALFFARAWPPATPSRLYEMGYRELAAVGKRTSVRAALSGYWHAVPRAEVPDAELASPGRDEESRQFRVQALESVEDWVLDPSEGNRVRAARFASTPGPYVYERTLANMAASRRTWHTACAPMIAPKPHQMGTPELSVRVARLEVDLGEWLRGEGDFVAERRGRRGRRRA
jgi:hypothetical protein